MTNLTTCPSGGDSPFCLVPPELKAHPQWVCWRYETRNGKRTKPPIDPNTRKYAQSNNPSTWSTYDKAVAVSLKYPDGIRGIGLMLSESDGLTGLDLDHVINPETLELNPLAAEVVAHFKDTYIEVSPSGEGLRIWCYGKPGRSGKCVGDKKWLEIYSHPSNRYLTVTGNRFGEATTVTEQQTALDWIHARFMEAPTQEKIESTGGGAPMEPVRPTFSPVDSSFDLSPDDNDLFAIIRRGKTGPSFDALMAGNAGDDHSDADWKLCKMLAFYTQKDAGRIDRIFRQSGLMQEKWDEVHYADGRTYGQGTINKAIADTREVYSGKKPRTVTTPKVESRQPSMPWTGTQPEENPYRGTDDANAILFLKLHGSDVRYCPPWDKWLLWTGSHWEIDEKLGIQKLTFDVPRMIYQKAAEELDREQRKWLGELARKLENTTKRANMLTSVKPRIVVHHSDLDKGNFLLNAANGTIDLKTGNLRPHERLDLLTHDTKIEYRKDAKAPTWKRFLNDILKNDAELISFVQCAIGYSLTGNIQEQVLFICHGVGSNGKSVFINVMRKLLGKLAIQAAPDLLMADMKQHHPTEQTDLFGKRVVSCQETGEGRRFNETLVKQLTGSDAIRARRMHEDFWEFDPTHKLWISTNHKPEIRGTDHAIWRRIQLIPFEVKFTEDGIGGPIKDKTMETKLMDELPGILAWAVQGCLTWQRDGLKPPKAVTQATDAYQAEMDVLAAWMADCCVVNKLADAMASSLYHSYSQWCEQSGERPEPQRRFGMRLTERGFESRKSTGGNNRWIGIGLLAPDDSGVSGVSGPENSFTEPLTSKAPCNPESSSTSSTSSTTRDSSPGNAPSPSVDSSLAVNGQKPNAYASLGESDASDVEGF